MPYTNYAPATPGKPATAAGCALSEGPPPIEMDASLSAADAAAGSFATCAKSREQLGC
jgi:hypothetical protein